MFDIESLIKTALKMIQIDKWHKKSPEKFKELKEKINQ